MFFKLLLWQHKITSIEAFDLFKILAETWLDQILSLNIRTSLTANHTVEHKKEQINDQIDILRLASGLPASDLISTDKQR
ncbi:hypothetical protein [Mucilaginibacter sp. SJ]|uniref:hypothetical protein n=1 Tax=Mucilaginibacter sp. SJ TaxID=3029053 RepID=UPI0023A9D13A|nr:hypothetical protein [Mucilaginibacter sp. SJ]WEA01848.1 hypothetical protein MusilaSJ_02780 [Mucilaginibacter sp. SJ]